MRVGTLTFHWASNYGAVLQAFALQRFLNEHGVETEIISYVPRRANLILLVDRLRRMKFADLVREHRLRRFRKSHLDVSRRTYRSGASLRNAAQPYDALVCGSDQIWNEWFTLKSEGASNLSYYLDFVPAGVARISYAASFGTDRLSDPVVELVQPELAKFQAISVREESAAEILAAMGLGSTVVVDPTLLLPAEAYRGLIDGEEPVTSYRLFSYLLHRDQSVAERVRGWLCATHFAGERLYGDDPISISEWLYHLSHAELVLTNSFHGVVFSLIFKRPFIVVPVQGAGDTMNGRFATLLAGVGLSDRMIEEFDEARVAQLLTEEIDWPAVDDALASMREASSLFLMGALDRADRSNLRRDH